MSRPVIAPVVIDIANPDTWPAQMLPSECAAVLRISRSTFYARIASGRFPPAPDGKSWSRELVQQYRAKVREYEERAEKRERRAGLRMVGGSR